MAKQIEDIIPGGDKRSIRDIPIPESRRKNINLINNNPTTAPAPYTPSEVNHSELEPTEQPIVQDIYIEKRAKPESVKHASEDVVPRMEVSEGRNFASTRRKRRLPNKSIMIGTLVLLLVLGLGIFSLMSGATITYKPKSAALTFNNETFTAMKEGKPGDLLFSVIKLSDEKSIEAPASGEEQVSTKASGQIIVYNNADSAPQRLIKNTRFETPDGKVYKVQNDITIPGKKGDQPGSLEVTVYADQPGESYNIGLSDFTLPGLKGDPKYKTIYARSKTPMTGGMVGLVKKVSAEDKVIAKKEIEESLKGALLEEAKAQVPSDFVLLPSLVEITYEDLPSASSTGDKASVTERGNFSGVIFKKADLVKYLASKKTTIGANEMVDADLEALQISSNLNNASISTVDKINLTVNGNTQLVWVVNEEEIKEQVADKNKNALQSILSNYPSIIEASGVVRPFWKTSFPDDPSKIKMVNDLN